ncbi:shikimate kinase [Microbacterium sp. ZKA21]|jgi:shikimate kinase|uniref:shikimate kinase n=1 Tax=Microbacterium sp. ZKA21 TaxID=3381694 RepID=UPI003D1D60C5
MSDDRPLTVVLVGPMGAGKTSVGRRVAKHLGVPFIDTDRRVVARYGPIPDIFAAHGEAHFRELERAAVADAVREGGVVSLGGGAVTDSGTRTLLRDEPVVFLSVSREAVAERIRGAGRPLLVGDEDPLDRWERIMHARQELYEQVSTIEFDTSRRPMARIAREIADWRRGLS